jgi:predicted nucleic acid-binding protein
MALILDTSVIIDLDRGHRETIEKLSELKKSHFGIPFLSFITYFEFVHGLIKKEIRNQERSFAFVELFSTIQTTKRTAFILSRLKQDYGDLPLSDLFIAAQSIENNLILVTKDNDFKRIKELNKIIL